MTSVKGGQVSDKKIIVLLVFLIFSVTCSSHNSTVFLDKPHKVSYGQKLCDPERAFPQLILIPFFQAATQVVPDCETYPTHQTTLALLVFYHHWLEHFGDEGQVVRDMLEQVMIRWGKSKRVSTGGYDLAGEKNSSGIFIGIVES